MRKQAGRIYCREMSKSPENHIEDKERQRVDQLRTIRKDGPGPRNLINQSRQNKKLQETCRQKESRYQSRVLQNSHQFSSIHQSSLTSLEQQLSLRQSKISNRSHHHAHSLETTFHNESNFADSLAVYENPLLKNNEIVKKLSHLNNIFKQIKKLRVEKLSRDVLNQINQTQRDLIEVERDILRTC